MSRAAIWGIAGVLLGIGLSFAIFPLADIGWALQIGAVVSDWVEALVPPSSIGSLTRQEHAAFSVQLSIFLMGIAASALGTTIVACIAWYLVQRHQMRNAKAMHEIERHRVFDALQDTWANILRERVVWVGGRSESDLTEEVLRESFAAVADRHYGAKPGSA